MKVEEKYVVDKQGKRVGVYLDIKEYQKILEELEEFESLRNYDKAKAAGDEVISFGQAVEEIEREHQ